MGVIPDHSALQRSVPFTQEQNMDSSDRDFIDDESSHREFSHKHFGYPDFIDRPVNEFRNGGLVAQVLEHISPDGDRVYSVKIATLVDNDCMDFEPRFVEADLIPLSNLLLDAQLWIQKHELEMKIAKYLDVEHPRQKLADEGYPLKELQGPNPGWGHRHGR
jgi:hypothetical protein